MTEKSAEPDHALIAVLADTLDVPLVLHGSSGISDEHLSLAISAGMTKINVGTALSVAFTRAVSAELAGTPTKVDPRKYIEAGREAMATEVARTLGAVVAPCT